MLSQVWGCNEQARIRYYPHRSTDAALGRRQGDRMRRREFIVLLGSVAAWPIGARAQQLPAVIGFLRPTKAEESGHLVAAVREGLRESGYPSEKILIDARWGNGREEQLPQLARELVAIQAAVIVAGSLPAARAAKAATGNIPIVFVTVLIRRPRGWCRVSVDRAAT